MVGLAIKLTPPVEIALTLFFTGGGKMAVSSSIQ
jgi:hypothetical protein